MLVLNLISMPTFSIYGSKWGSVVKSGRFLGLKHSPSPHKWTKKQNLRERIALELFIITLLSHWLVDIFSKVETLNCVIISFLLKKVCKMSFKRSQRHIKKFCFQSLVLSTSEQWKHNLYMGPSIQHTEAILISSPILEVLIHKKGGSLFQLAYLR